MPQKRTFHGDPPPIPGQQYRILSDEEAEARKQAAREAREAAPDAEQLTPVPDAGNAAPLPPAEEKIIYARATPFMRRRPQMPVISRILRDPHTPGVGYPCSLRAPDSAANHAAADLVERMAQKYLGTDDIPPKEDFPSADEVRLNRNLFLSVATVCEMQCAPEEEGFPALPPYTFEELVMLAHTQPNLWEAMLGLAGEVQERGAEALKNAPPEGAAFMYAPLSGT